MSPGLLSDLPDRTQGDNNSGEHGFPKPLHLSGALEKFSYEDTTPVIGREFLNANIVDDLLYADNTDELLRDLAITSKPHLAATAH